MKHLGIFIILSISILACSFQKPSEIILQDESFSSIFIPIKELDPKNYDSLALKIDDLAKTNISYSALFEKSQKLGLEFYSKYFNSAQDKALVTYLQNYVNFIKTQLLKDPLLIARIESPDVFDNLNKEQLKILNKEFAAENNRLIIKSAINNPQQIDPLNDQLFSAKFFEKYVLSHEDSADVLGRVSKKTDINIFARVMLQFYEYTLSLQEHEIAMVLRYLRTVAEN